MKFKMNNREWEIKEVNQDKMRELENDDDEKNTYYGLTTYDNQTIWIWNDLHPNQKRQTLIHELFHCYVGCYYSFQETVYTEELVCNLVGNSHDIIHEIVEEYFSPKINIANPYILTPEMLEDKNRTITGNIDWGNNDE